MTDCKQGFQLWVLEQLVMKKVSKHFKHFLCIAVNFPIENLVSLLINESFFFHPVENSSYS